MTRYEVTTETDRSIVHRTTGKLPTEVRVRHHARSMEHALGDLLTLTLYPDGRWELRGDGLQLHSVRVHDDATTARPFTVGGNLPTN